MPELTTTLGPLSARTFTVMLVLAALCGAGALVARGDRERHNRARRSALIDAGLGGLVGAAIGGRLIHVLLNLDYFADHGGEALRLSAGGLDWHGAVLGGLVGLAVVARWRRLPLADLLAALAPVLPLTSMAIWYGCWAAGCGYGMEVDTLARYPAVAVSESRDVYGIIAPRYNTPLFGIAMSAGILLVALLLLRTARWRFGRFWLVLALLALGMLVVGFMRGDYSPDAAGLRLDQWLDMGMIALSLGALRYSSLADRRTSPLKAQEANG